MTERHELLEQLERVNPVPDPGQIYADVDDARRFRAAVDERRADRRWIAVVPFPWRWNSTRLWSAGLAFGAVIVIGAVTVLFFDTDEPPVAGGELVTTTVAAPSTTFVPQATTAVPPPSTTEPPPDTTIATTATEPPGTTTTTLARALTTSFLSDSEVAPAGLPQVSNPIMGDGPSLCTNDDEILFYEGPPAILRSSLVYEGGLGPFFCIVGFDTERPVNVLVSADGAVLREYTIEPAVHELAGAGIDDKAYSFVWRSLPSDPLGEYQIRVEQGLAGAESTFEVIAPQVAGHSIEPRRAPAGSVIDVVLYGQAPDADVTLHFYRQQEEPAFPPSNLLHLDYVASVTVSTDANGWAVLHVKTGTDDPRRGYLVGTLIEDLAWPVIAGGCICPFAEGVFELAPPE